MMTKESPLKGMSTGNVATVSIRELPRLNNTDLRVAPGTPSQIAVAGALGVNLTQKPGQLMRKLSDDGNEIQALCLAPDWWIITGIPDIEQRLGTLLLISEYHFSAVDVSGQRTAIELEGPNARAVLAHLWDQDLREKSFPVGSVSQGLMAKAPVIVCHTAPGLYRIMVRSSFALHLWKALVDASQEWV